MRKGLFFDIIVVGMKKTIKKRFTLLFVLFSLCSCKPEPFSVDKSIENLKSKGWEVFEISNSLETITEYINLEIKNYWHENFEIQTIKLYVNMVGPNTIPATDPNWIPPRIVFFTVFDNELDASNYVNLLLNRAKKDNYLKMNAYIALLDNIYVHTNSFEATKLINLNFTLI